IHAGEGRSQPKRHVSQVRCTGQMWSTRTAPGGGGRVPDRQPIPIGAPRTGLAPRVPLRKDAAASAGPTPWGRRPVVLLNATFEPLTALPLRRAVVLVVRGKAEVVHGDPAGFVLHSATASVAVPSVIRLATYVRIPYRGRVPLTRAGLMHRDRYRCAYCG